MQEEPEFDITIIGGGITALAAAYMASKSGYKVQLIEASDQMGGLIRTTTIGGQKIECFYHHFFNHDKELMWLLNALGLEDKVIRHKTKMGLYSNKQFQSFSGLLDMLRLSGLSWSDRIRFILSTAYLAFKASWQKYDDVSAYEWLKKKAGKQTTELIWAPLLRVKFGNHYDHIPLSWLIGRLKQRLSSRKYGEELNYLKGSFQVLADAIEEHLKANGVKLLLNTKVTSLSLSDDKIIAIKSQDISLPSSRHYLFTVSNAIVNGLLKDSKQFQLPEVEYFKAVCLMLVMDQPLTQYYWTNIADSDLDFGGIIEQTNFISQEEYGGNHIVYLSRYFDHEDELNTMSEGQIVDLFMTQLKQLFNGFNEESIKEKKVFIGHNAAPFCHLGFSKKVRDTQLKISNGSVANMVHVYPDERSVNNSIKLAYKSLKSIPLKIEDISMGQSLAAEIGFDE